MERQTTTTVKGNFERALFSQGLQAGRSMIEMWRFNETSLQLAMSTLHHHQDHVTLLFILWARWFRSELIEP
eukprot:5994659-Amphidinium_carterae.1